MAINIYNQYTNVRQAATDRNSHGLSPSDVETMNARFEKFAPELATLNTHNQFRSLFADKLPEGASWPARTAQSFPGGNNPGGGRQMITQQTPYQPEFASPDRQQYPVHRILANRYWRLFYKLDPVVGNCIELYSELPWSNFELTGDGVEGEIRQAYEQMCRETQVLALLPYFVKEFLVVGEVVPHTFFDNDKGIFTYIALHNPDQLEVIDAPFIKMDPIVEFIPDDRLRAVLTSDNPSLRKIKERMPPELLSRLYSRQNIPLSPINATFIPRKLHPYDTRGTSILSRMWRVLMLEDAVFNATIQTARRHAAPLKVAKLGNAATGWIPPPEQEKRLLELLAQAEQDPNAWLVYHYGIQFEAVGTTDRVMSVNKEWDIIERIKLVALGISKSFLHGEVSYASSATGLQVFLQRLKSLRMFFEQKWLYPKFFRPIAEINGWVKPRPSEVNHRYRVKRSAQELEEQNAYIIPKIVWDKSLDPQINTALITAMQALETMGVKFSKTSKMATAGYSFEEETKKLHREIEFEKTFLPKIQMPGQQQGQGGGGAPPMGGGDMPPPPGAPPEGGEGKAPPGSGGEGPPPGVQGPPIPPKATSKDATPGSVEDLLKNDENNKPTKSTNENLSSQIWHDDKYGNWKADEVADLLDLLQHGNTDNAFWSQLGTQQPFLRAMQSQDANLLWDSIEDYLDTQNYPSQDISELHEILTHENVLPKPETLQKLQQIENALPDDPGMLTDEEFVAKIQAAIRAQGPVRTSSDSFLSGNENTSDPKSLISDLSTVTPRKRK